MTNSLYSTFSAAHGWPTLYNVGCICRFSIKLKTTLPSCAHTPGSASPSQAGCWLLKDPETGHIEEAEGVGRCRSLGHKLTSEPPHSWLSTGTDSEGQQSSHWPTTETPVDVLSSHKVEPDVRISETTFTFLHSNTLRHTIYLQNKIPTKAAFESSRQRSVHCMMWPTCDPVKTMSPPGSQTRRAPQNQRAGSWPWRSGGWRHSPQCDRAMTVWAVGTGEGHLDPRADANTWSHIE